MIADIAELAKKTNNNEEIFFGLAVKDIKNATDLLKSVYDEEVKGADGYVSLEVSPFLALKTAGNRSTRLKSYGNRLTAKM